MGRYYGKETTQRAELLRLQLEKAGIRMSTDDACQLALDGKRYGALQVEHCNRGLTPNQEARERGIEKRVTSLLAKYGLPVEFGGDPRGYVIKTKLPGQMSNSWGGDGTWGIA